MKIKPKQEDCSFSLSALVVFASLGGKSKAPVWRPQ